MWNMTPLRSAKIHIMLVTCEYDAVHPQHSGAHHIPRNIHGYDIRTVQELLGHRDIRTTQIDVHVLNRGGRGVRSPLDPR